MTSKAQQEADELQARMDAAVAKIDDTEMSRRLGVRLSRGQWVPKELPLPNPNRRWATKEERAAANLAALDKAFTKPTPKEKKV